MKAEHDRRVEDVAEVGTRMPGFVSIKTFEAEDGERVTLVAFETLEQQRAWPSVRLHRDAQRDGRERFYAEYRISICEELERRDFTTGRP